MVCTSLGRGVTRCCKAVSLGIHSPVKYSDDCVVSVAIKMGATKADFDSTVAIRPWYSLIFTEAG